MRNNIRDIYASSNERPVLIAGPMVRYSKLPLRETIREVNARFNTKHSVIIYTPMILAREFCRNPVARRSDFTTSDSDTPLLIQFGAANKVDLARSCLMVRNWCDGIGLNCGCPIREQCREGVGAALMVKPHLVADMVKEVKKVCGLDFFVEVKIRIHTDLKVTQRFARIVEAAGADSICVHGRRKDDRSGNVRVNLPAIRLIKNSVKIPVIANGDFWKPKDMQLIYDKTQVNGIMSARGILANPALFAGFERCPWAAIEIFWDHAMNSGLPFQLILHHLAEMFRGRGELRHELTHAKTTVDLIDWFDLKFDFKRRGEEGFGLKDEWPIIE